MYRVVLWCILHILRSGTKGTIFANIRDIFLSVFVVALLLFRASVDFLLIFCSERAKEKACKCLKTKQIQAFFDNSNYLFEFSIALVLSFYRFVYRVVLCSRYAFIVICSGIYGAFSYCCKLLYRLEFYREIEFLCVLI